MIQKSIFYLADTLKFFFFYQIIWGFMMNLRYEMILNVYKLKIK